MQTLIRASTLTASLLVFIYAPLFAQFSDSLKVSIGTTATFATKDYQPLWIEALEFGTISQRGADLSSHVLLRNSHVLGKRQHASADINMTVSGFYLDYGLDLYNNNHFQAIFTKEAYVKAGYKYWEIRAGEFVEIVGEVDPELSSGSFAVSGNALPIPKIGLAVTEYTDVPFTNGFLQFKGLFSHGWLGQTNYVKGAYLHEKSLYLRAGGKQLRFHVGLSHFANWAGIHPNGKAPSRFKDFLRIIAGAAGDAEDSVYHQGPVDIANAVGNHMITSDIGMEIKLSKGILKVFTQTIFEKGKGDSSNTNQRDELIALNIFGKDRLIGISWETLKPAFLQKLLIEGVYTKDQGGPVVFNGRFNYYNNATYATGWEYQDHIIGTPLFINRHRAAQYDLDPTSDRGWNIVSNRIIGFHTGTKGFISKKISYRTLFTYVRHYGNYYNEGIFSPSKGQNNLLFEIDYRLNSNVVLTAAFAMDQGDLSKNKGGKLAAEWILK